MLAALAPCARATVVSAQDAAKSPEAGASTDEVDERSPRAAVTAYLEAARLGRFGEAARYLDLPQDRRSEGQVLAFRVKAALDRHLWIDIDALSATAEGALDDGLAPQLEQIGKIEGSGGKKLPVRLVRAQEGDPIAWRFTRTTVRDLDTLYGEMPHHLILEHVPASLQRMGPGDLAWWQWLALPVLLLLGGLLAGGLAWVTRYVLLRVARSTHSDWDDALVARMRGPLWLLWGIGLGYLVLPQLALAVPAEERFHVLLRTGAVLGLFWSALRSVDLVSDVLRASPAMQVHSARALLPVLTRITKAGVMAMLVVAVLSGLGLPVASLVAGLGVGGIALALAAQKTVENVFGAVSIGVDVPFQVGDFVRVGDALGTVETLGLRSTRIRTLDRTLLTIPNGGLADARVENYTARDRIRLATTIGLEYGTSEAQLRAVLEQVEAALRAHPRIWPDAVVVRFVGFGASSLDIDIMAWFQTRDWNEFQGFRQQMLLEMMSIVERNGTSFAFPTRTLHVYEHDRDAT